MSNITNVLPLAVAVGITLTGPSQAAPYVQEWNGTTLRPAFQAAPQFVFPKYGFAQAPVRSTPAIPGDYFTDEIAHGAMHWNHPHLTVYIEPGGVGYRNSCGKIFLQCLQEWSRASGGYLQFFQTPYPQEADIVVDWLAAPPAAGEAGNTQLAFRNFGGQRILAHAHIDIAALVNGRQTSDSEIKKTCLHELGHALGLVHTSLPCDIMYYRSNPAQGTSLSARDAMTIKRLYRTG